MATSVFPSQDFPPLPSAGSRAASHTCGWRKRCDPQPPPSPRSPLPSPTPSVLPALLPLPELDSHQRKGAGYPLPPLVPHLVTSPPPPSASSAPGSTGRLWADIVKVKVNVNSPDACAWRLCSQEMATGAGCTGLDPLSSSDSSSATSDPSPPSPSSQVAGTKDEAHSSCEKEAVASHTAPVGGPAPELDVEHLGELPGDSAASPPSGAEDDVGSPLDEQPEDFPSRAAVEDEDEKDHAGQVPQDLLTDFSEGHAGQDTDHILQTSASSHAAAAAAAPLVSQDGEAATSSEYDGSTSRGNDGAGAAPADLTSDPVMVSPAHQPVAAQTSLSGASVASGALVGDREEAASGASLGSEEEAVGEIEASLEGGPGRVLSLCPGSAAGAVAGMLDAKEEVGAEEASGSSEGSSPRAGVPRVFPPGVHIRDRPDRPKIPRRSDPEGCSRPPRWALHPLVAGRDHSRYAGGFQYRGAMLGRGRMMCRDSQGGWNANWKDNIPQGPGSFHHRVQGSRDLWAGSDSWRANARPRYECDDGSRPSSSDASSGEGRAGGGGAWSPLSSATDAPDADMSIGVHRLADVSRWLWGTPDPQSAASTCTAAAESPLVAVPALAPVSKDAVGLATDGSGEMAGYAPCLLAVDPLFLIKATLQQQIEYYFSVSNLVKDVFLRSHMDEQGFVPVSVIAGFNRIRVFHVTPSFILDAISHSAIVQVQGEAVRRRHGWQQWLPAPGFASGTGAGKGKHSLTTEEAEAEAKEAIADDAHASTEVPAEDLRDSADGATELTPTSEASSEGSTTPAFQAPEGHVQESRLQLICLGA